MSKIIKNSIISINNGDAVNPTIANQPHTDLETNIDTIINYIDISSIGMFDYDSVTSTGLIFEYTAGTFKNSSTFYSIVAGNRSLSATNTSYIEIDSTLGTVVHNIVGFTEGNVPLWEVVADGSSITSVTDRRSSFAPSIYRDSSGNVGIGVTPSAWGSAWNTIQINTLGSITSNSKTTYIGSNAYHDGTNWRRIATGFSVLKEFESNGGVIREYVAVSDAADSIIIWTVAQTINNDGSVTIPNVNITGGSIDGAVIGGSTPAAATATTLTATGAFTSLGIDDNATSTALTIASDGSHAILMSPRVGVPLTVKQLAATSEGIYVEAFADTKTIRMAHDGTVGVIETTYSASEGYTPLVIKASNAVAQTINVDGSITIPNVAITGGSVTGITDLAVADGGTGASTAGGARTALAVPALVGNNVFSGDQTIGSAGSGAAVLDLYSDVGFSGGTIAAIDFFGSPGFVKTKYGSFRFDTSADNGIFEFWSVGMGNAGGPFIRRMWMDDGMIVGTPAGGTAGDMGTGTINANAVYDDGSLLSCYVFEQYIDGKIDLKKWDERVPNVTNLKGDVIEERTHTALRQFKSRIGSKYDPLNIDSYTKHWKENKHLTSMPNKEKYNVDRGLSSGQWIQRLVETVEIQAVHISQLNARLKNLEAK